MAKLLIEIEDTPGGELDVRFVIDPVRSRETASTNTPTQNIAIYLAQQMRAIGLRAPEFK